MKIENFLALIIAVLVVIITGMGVSIIWNVIVPHLPINCEKDRGWGHPEKYYMDTEPSLFFGYISSNPCFNVTYRCQVECGNFGKNFTGEMDGCACDCGDAFVSMCSGFMRMKEPTGNEFYYNKTVTCPAYDKEGNPSTLCEEE